MKEENFRVAKKNHFAALVTQSFDSLKLRQQCISTTTLSCIITFGGAGTGHHADGRRCQLQQGPELTEGLPVGAPEGDERSVEVQPARY